MIEDGLAQKIDLLKKEDSKKVLSQAEITKLLFFVQEELKSFHFACESFFLADYSTDRLELVSFLSAKAGHHHRKAFSLVADPVTVYKIDEKEIL